MRKLYLLAVCGGISAAASAFVAPSFGPSRSTTSLSASMGDLRRWAVDSVCAASLAVAVAVAVAVAPAFADEFGVEKDAPTLFTGETVEVCNL